MYIFNLCIKLNLIEKTKKSKQAWNNATKFLPSTKEFQLHWRDKNISYEENYDSSN